MGTVTGRTLDDDGRPVTGTGFDIDGGPLADLIARRTGPITSHPTRPVWSAPVDAAAVDDGTVGAGTEAEPGRGGRPAVRRTVDVLGAGYEGPPRHYHEVSEERFSVREGALTFTCDGRTRRVAAGETLRVPTGVEHTFRTVGDERAVVVTEIDPPGRIATVLQTLGGLAHEGRGDDALQRALIVDRLRNDTVFTTLEARVLGPLADVLAPVARARGYRAAYDRYRRPAFWHRHVEQPSESESRPGAP